MDTKGHWRILWKNIYLTTVIMNKYHRNELSLIAIKIYLTFLPMPGPFAPYWPHVRGFWSKRKEPNILFLKYEEMIDVSRLNIHLVS